ncbi:MAG TPA: ABC transporter permease [Gammaproteobacteria bacterium]|nr:ABC transporter permease [Gammaproteobacteria bacterium]
MRLWGLVYKETWQILRDPSSISIAFVLPVILLLIFGYGVSLDARDVPIAVVVQDPTPETASLTGAFSHSPYLVGRPMATMRAARRALSQGRVRGIVVLRGDYTRRLLAHRDPAVQVIVNGVDANTGRLVLGYVQGAWATWLQQRARRHGLSDETPVEMEQRVRFNPEVRSRNFLVPGLIAIIMTLIGALLTSLVVAREWERGTMEALMVTPVSVGEILLGKLIPYFLLGMGGMALSVFMALLLFKVPLVGSAWVLLCTAALFLLVALGMGLLISTVTKNQFAAGQTAIIVTFLPAFILSGFIFDIGSMPAPIQWITHLIAARYFVAILQTVFLAGNVWSVILPNSLALIAMAAVFLGLTWRISHKRLE